MTGKLANGELKMIDIKLKEISAKCGQVKRLGTTNEGNMQNGGLITLVKYFIEQKQIKTKWK